MRLNGMIKPLLLNGDFKKIINSMENEYYPINVSGIADSSKAFMIYAMFQESNKSAMILTHSDIEARNLYEDLNLFTTDVFYFPNKEVVFYNIDSISGDVRWERLKVIKEMLSERKKIIITSIESIASSYIPLDSYRDYTIEVKVGKNIDIKDMSKKLVESGYDKVECVERKGQFAVRGGIIDIYCPIYSEPYRIELFDDEVDSIRNFNIESQRSINKAEAITIFPAKELILDEQKIQKGTLFIKEDFNDIVEKFNKKGNVESAERIKSKIDKCLEELSENGGFETIDSFINYFYENPSTFLQYAEEYTIFIDDLTRCKGKLDSVYFEFEENYKSFIERGNVLPNQGNLLYDKNKILQDLSLRNIITIDSIYKPNKIIAPRVSYAFNQVTLSNYHGQLDLLISDIKEKKKDGYKIVILSGTRPRGERLVETLRDREIESTYKDNVDLIFDSEVIITFGSQLTGYEFPDLKLCIISDKEVFGDYKRKLRKNYGNKKGVSKIKSFTELKPGDYVVHVNHGIGVYKGIRQIELDTGKKDYLVLSYENEDKLYVPVEQLDLVQKYIGSEGNAPRLNKLGGNEWNKAKTKVKKSIEEIAQDLVKLYATRVTVKGFKFSKDTPWQKQFEEEFPFEETPDQLTSIEDIKEDMESDKPMDRLLCGDVGYGKTEVAMRAAFKAVMDGKQVAFLVPTTILAQQHYNNMIKRFSDFPVKIDVISRFRTLTQQRATMKAVKEGNVDILIGTHRLLSKEISFKDLGLLIIDEEQRFGVSQKEKIKKFKKNVDVLTLSATPIPRTLHMSLIGVRDISVIETPPEERYPVQTYVVDFNDQLIRDAVLREIGRGGQVYFVYNRVETINEMAGYISNLIPEARVGIAHGQMSERELESVIMAFTNNEFDVLISTTIIETGMDIQNVNTMIISNADKMGLSQLYQLRGRVGRTNKIAYCYLTYTKDKVLTEVAEKRLKALKDFTELGSGFKIALKDLEIRGAGNMMGSAQHGHMASIGYDLYCRMLEDTVKLIKGDIEKEPIETTIEIKTDAYVPGYYIKDEMQKIEVYKKIASIESEDDAKEIIDELEDRFSTIPVSVQNLINIAYLKSIAKGIGVEEIKQTNSELVFTFERTHKINPAFFSDLMRSFQSNISIKVKSEKPAFGYKLNDEDKLNVVNVLKNIVLFMKKYY